MAVKPFMMGIRPALVLATFITTAVAAPPNAAASSSAWTHDWATPASAWWGYGAMGGELFSDDTVAFVARTYRVVALSLCVGPSMNMSVAQGIMNVSARLKAINPSIKVVQYWNVQQWACYRDDDAQYRDFLSHPEFWLRDDNGNTVVTGPNNSPQYDWRNEAAVQHFVEQIMPLPPDGRYGNDEGDGDASAVHLIDGFLFDGAAGFDQPANVSQARAEALKLAKWHAIGRVQQRLTEANGGLALANGMIGGPSDPDPAAAPYNLGVLDFVNGIENERGTPTFELVDAGTGAFKKDVVAANMAALEKAGEVANGTKVVTVNYWAGPIVGFDASTHLPTFAPNDPINHAPNGTQAEQMLGWQQLLATWLPFNLAMFLSIAGPSSYFTQMVWYAASQGFAPCTAAPDSCCAPRPFYPMMSKPLGPPAGPRKQVGQYKWVRHFEHAVVTVDLDDPLGPGTAVTFTS